MNKIRTFVTGKLLIMKKLTSLLILILTVCSGVWACTSMIVPAKNSSTGRPLLWKHRDTGADNNFLARVEAQNGEYGYVGLFNGGDSLLREAWMGMNDAGFAIMNTASYNLAPDTADFKDQEGVVMAGALKCCATVDDFEKYLESLPKPMGVQANFGVIDADGNAAYFETDDKRWWRFDVADSIVIRTNYSFMGEEGKGSGYIRYNTADFLLSEARDKSTVSPQFLTDTVSRSFYHSLLGRDCYNDDHVVNQDFIPRDISTSSIVIEGVVPGADKGGMRMWAILGYPPCGDTRLVTLNEIPEDYLPKGAQWRSEACDRAMQLRKSTIPFEGGNGKRYIDMRKLRPINERMRDKSLENYKAANM